MIRWSTNYFSYVQVIGWWLIHGLEDKSHVVQDFCLTTYNAFPTTFFSFLNVFMCITPDFDESSYGSVDTCSEWFNPHLKQYMRFDYTTPEPVSADQWHVLKNYYVKGE